MEADISNNYLECVYYFLKRIAEHCIKHLTPSLDKYKEHNQFILINDGYIIYIYIYKS